MTTTFVLYNPSKQHALFHYYPGSKTSFIWGELRVPAGESAELEVPDGQEETYRNQLDKQGKMLGLTYEEKKS